MEELCRPAPLREQLACHDCDLLMTRPARRGRLVCPRCGARLPQSAALALESSLALVIAGLIVLVIANLCLLYTSDAADE